MAHLSNMECKQMYFQEHEDLIIFIYLYLTLWLYFNLFEDKNTVAYCMNKIFHVNTPAYMSLPAILLSEKYRNFLNYLRIKFYIDYRILFSLYIKNV